jgi:DNA-binding protein YbaB
MENLTKQLEDLQNSFMQMKKEIDSKLIEMQPTNPDLAAKVTGDLTRIFELAKDGDLNALNELKKDYANYVNK